jgi:hypothetical protein
MIFLSNTVIFTHEQSSNRKPLSIIICTRSVTLTKSQNDSFGIIITAKSIKINLFEVVYIVINRLDCSIENAKITQHFIHIFIINFFPD